MMDDDDGFTASDAEIDSEIEDTDLDGELGVWLDQLNSYSQEDTYSGSPRKPAPPPNLNQVRSKVTLTPKLVMDSFRSSILDGGDGQDLDLDAILGELCQLETTLSTQQSEINTSMKTAGISDISPVSDAPYTPPTDDRPKPEKSSASRNLETLAELESAMEDDLENALSELSDLVGSTFPESTSHKNGNDSTTCDDVRNLGNSSLTMTPGGSGVQMVDGGIPGARKQGVVAQCQDYSPDAADVDSAFSDSSSLPSSGSHISMTTTSSQNSNGSAGSTGSSGMGLANVGMEKMFGLLELDDIKQHLVEFQAQLQKSGIPPAEQAAKMKAEKVRIALEKIKEANIQKLFVRFHSEDGCSKSILVDEKMTLVQILERLIAKNTVTPSIDWSVIEHLPELYMERLLEDHELMVEPLLMWTRDSKNKLLFVQSPGKYQIFRTPEVFLQPDKKEEVSDCTRGALIREYFSEDASRTLDMDGHLYLKAEGKKAWKKYFFVLRASGLYYSPKGKGKTSKDLLCLQKLDIVDVYTAVSWKKKYKAPTDYGFALKHPQIQKKTPKYIKYLCAEDQKTFTQWVTGIRMIKHGQQLMKNYKQMKKSFETYDPNDILPNQNFADYLAKQNERNQEFAKENHLRPRQSFCSTSTYSSEGNGDGNNTLPRDTSDSSLNRSPQRRGSNSQLLANNGSMVRKLSSNSIGNPISNTLECRRGSFPLIDYNQNREYQSSDEDVRPGKMNPILPVTTQITRQLTEQNAASGTLKRRPSQGTLKRHRKSILQNDDGSVLPPPPPGQNDSVDAVDDLPLPPPPPELLHPQLEEVAYSVVNVNQSPGNGYQDSRVGGSLPCSPLKRPSVSQKPMAGMIQVQAFGAGASPVTQPPFSAPQSPAPHAAQSQAPGPPLLCASQLPGSGQLPVSHVPAPPKLPGSRPGMRSSVVSPGSRPPPPPQPQGATLPRMLSNSDQMSPAHAPHMSPSHGPPQQHMSPAHGPSQLPMSPAHGSPHMSPAHGPPQLHMSPAHGPPQSHMSPAHGPAQSHMSPAHGPPQPHMSPANASQQQPIYSTIHQPPPTPSKPSPQTAANNASPAHGPHMSPAHGPHMSPAHGPHMSPAHGAQQQPIYSTTHQPPPTPSKPSPQTAANNASPAHGPQQLHMSPAHGPQQLHMSPAHGPQQRHMSPAHGPQQLHMSPAHGPQQLHMSPAHAPQQQPIYSTTHQPPPTLSKPSPQTAALNNTSHYASHYAASPAPAHAAALQYSSPTHQPALRRGPPSPAKPETSPLKRPPPLPKRSQNTKLSLHGDSPQTQYFISDLQRVLAQKQEWSREITPEQSFPPNPPPHQGHRVAPPMDEEWLPPPPAELLVELQQARHIPGGYGNDGYYATPVRYH